MHVVERLEVVDVEQDHAERMPETLGAAQGAGQPVVPGAAVGHAGEHVGAGVDRQAPHELAALELAADERRDVGERGKVLDRPGARRGVDRAEAPEDVPGRRHDRKAGVGDDVEVADREVRAQDRVLARVLDHERDAVGDDVLAEGVRQRRLPGIGPRLGDPAQAREVLAVVGDDRDERRGRVDDARRETGEAIEDRLGRAGVQPRRPERLQALGVVQRRAEARLGDDGWLGTQARREIDRHRLRVSARRVPRLNVRRHPRTRRSRAAGAGCGARRRGGSVRSTSASASRRRSANVRNSRVAGDSCAPRRQVKANVS